MSDRSDRSGPPGLIPDLDLPGAKKPAKTASTAREATPAPAPTSRSVDGEIDLGGSGGGGGSYDLDDDFSTGSSSLGGFQAEAVQAQNVPTEEPWPRGVSPVPDSLDIDEVEIRLTADFGDLPAHWILSPPYALKVWQRRKALRPRIAELEAKVVVSEAKRDKILADIVRGLRESLGDEHQDLSRLLAPVRAAEGRATERSAGLAATNDEYRTKVGVVDAKMGGLRANLADHESTLSGAQALVAEKDDLFRRASAAHKRVLIEIRSAKQILERAEQAGQPPPPATVGQVQALEAKAQTLQSPSDEAKAELDRVKAVEASVRAEVDRARQAIRGAEKERQEIEKAFAKQLGVRGEAVQEADQKRNAALAEVGRSVLALRGALAVDAAVRTALFAADDAVLRDMKAAERHRRALVSGDEVMVKRGFQIAAGAVAALVLGLILAVAGAGSKDGAPKENPEYQ